MNEDVFGLAASVTGIGGFLSEKLDFVVLHGICFICCLGLIRAGLGTAGSCRRILIRYLLHGFVLSASTYAFRVCLSSERWPRFCGRLGGLCTALRQFIDTAILLWSRHVSDTLHQFTDRVILCLANDYSGAALTGR